MTTLSQCVAWNCPTRRRGDETDDPSISFFPFPLNRPEAQAKWLENMGEPVWKPTRASVLCSKHFNKDAFMQSFAHGKLKLSAVPIYFEKRPSPQMVIDLDKRTANEVLSSGVVAATGDFGGSGGKSAKRRKVVRRYDPAEELVGLHQLLSEERFKRRELEQEIFKLRQEKAEMTSKMNRLEAARVKPNIPTSLLPILVDAMTRGVDPLKKPEVTSRSGRKAQAATPTKPKTPARVAPAPAKTTPLTTSTPTLASTAAKLAASSPKVLQLPQQVTTPTGKTVSFSVPAASPAINSESPAAGASQPMEANAQ